MDQGFESEGGMGRTRVSTLADYADWLKLAAEVEPLFGPMAGVPSFREGLKRAIAHGRAICAVDEGPARPTTFLGGVVFSTTTNEIRWLAVLSNVRGTGVGSELLSAALDRLDRTKPITVTTFAESVEPGEAARRLYRSFGFSDSTPGGINPAGIRTVVMTLAPRRGQPE